MSGSSGEQNINTSHVLHETWDDVVGGYDWIKSVFFGEFADNRPLSAIIADMLVSFIPAVVIAVSARDAVAVILRMAKHPEKREDLMEWVLLCACLITIALPLAMAGVGLAAAGVGAVVTGIAGSELGAALRVVMLLLIKASTKLVEVVEFLQKFIKGDIIRFLRAIKFSQYEKVLIGALRRFNDKLIDIVQGMIRALEKLPSIQYTRDAIAKLKSWEHSFYAVQREAIKSIPKALAELDVRLAKVVAEIVSHEVHTVPAGVKAEKPVARVAAEQKVADAPGKILRAREKPVATPEKPKAEATKKVEPPAKPLGEKPPLKEKADEPLPIGDKSNTKKQNVIDPKVAADREEINALVKAGKIDEARAMLKPYIPKSADDSWKPFIDRLDISSPKDKAVFWSGDPKAAQRYAANIGGVTLETTSGGKVIDGWDEVNKLPWGGKSGPPPWSGDLWNGVSKKYADAVTGEVNIVQTPAKLWDQGTVWQNSEKAIIQDKVYTGEVSRVKINTVNKAGDFIPLSKNYVNDLMSLKGIPR